MLISDRKIDGKNVKKAPILLYESFQCPEPDSNQHTLRHMHLKHACLPFHHRGRQVQMYAFFEKKQSLGRTFFIVSPKKRYAHDVCRELK